MQHRAIHDTLEIMRWGQPGPSAPLLLLHEGLGSVSLWRDFPDELARRTGREVVAWSRAGHGSTPDNGGAHELDYMHREADKLPGLLDALGVDRVHLFGHSDGASIALIAAADMGARIVGLILEAPHVFVEPLTVASIAAMQCRFDESDLNARLARHHVDGERVFRRWSAIWLDPRFLDWNIEHSLSYVAAPILLIQGRDDEFGTKAQLDCIGAALTDTRQMILSACGHSPHRDQRAAVIDATVAFLKDLP